jgi:hypothetical protein
MERELMQLAGALHRSFLARMAKCCMTDPSSVMDAALAVNLLAAEDVEEAFELKTNSSQVISLVQLAVKHDNISPVLKESKCRTYVASFISTIHHVVLTGEGRDDWLQPSVEGRIVSVALGHRKPGDLALRLKITTESGDCINTTLNERAVYASFYSDPKVFSRAGQATCLLLDYALHRGGTG